MNRVVLSAAALLATAVLLAGCAKPPEPPAATQASEPENITEGATVSASDWEQTAKGGWKDFPAEKTLDGDLAKLSSWRAEAEGSEHGQWIQYDLGRVRTVALVKLAFLEGDARIYRFEIELSPNGQDWTKVFIGESGGQADFAQGAMFSEGGQAFIVLPSTTKGGAVSRISVSLRPGTVVTTLKNTVDHVATEWGVAHLRGRSINERARALIAVADPAHRDDLERGAWELGYLR